eukprot:gene8169-9701_t
MSMISELASLLSSDRSETEHVLGLKELTSLAEAENNRTYVPVPALRGLFVASQNSRLNFIPSFICGIPRLVHLLEAGPDKEVTAAAATGLANLALNAANKDAIRESGALPKLVELIKAGPHVQAAEKAARAIMNLSSNATNRELIREVGAVPPLVKLLTAGSTKVVTEHAVWALANLAKSSPANQGAIAGAGAAAGFASSEAPAAIGAVKEYGAIPALLELLQDSVARPSARRRAAVTLFRLAELPDNRPTMLDAGAAVRLEGYLLANCNVSGYSVYDGSRRPTAMALAEAFSLQPMASLKALKQPMASLKALKQPMASLKALKQPLASFDLDQYRLLWAGEDEPVTIAAATALANLATTPINKETIRNAWVHNLKQADLAEVMREMTRLTHLRLKHDDQTRVLNLKDLVHGMQLLTRSPWMLAQMQGPEMTQTLLAVLGSKPAPHLHSCMAKKGTLEAILPQITTTQSQKLHRRITLWLVRRKRPLSLPENDPEFRKFFDYIFSGGYVPPCHKLVVQNMLQLSTEEKYSLSPCTLAVGFEGGGPYVKTGRDARRKGPKGFLPMVRGLWTRTQWLYSGDWLGYTGGGK